MSGICGVVNFDGAPVDLTQLKKMAAAVSSRGPDGINYWIKGHVGLAHLALNSTPESLREHQPLQSTDGLVCLTADARVDNRLELISTLTSKGYLQMENPTDADLILSAYFCWDDACPGHIIGDFAFAIWDARKGVLFSARDAFGIKPLHYARIGQTIWLASEAQQIIQDSAIPRHLDEVTVALHLANNCYDEERTMFQGVRKLPPAHHLSAMTAAMRLERYWDIDPKVRTVYRRDEDYTEHFLHLFREAVASRLRTQANTVGITMSGGLDSTSIATMAQQLRRDNEQLPHLIAYSYVFDSLKDCDERIYSQAMATGLGIDVEFIQGEHFWMLDDTETFRPSLETPFMFWESLDRHILGRIKERKARVVLSGHGGDILLEGSPLVYADRLLRGELKALWELQTNAKEWREPYRDLLREFVAKPLVPAALKRVRR